jgi:hypothetical protein
MVAQAVGVVVVIKVTLSASTILLLTTNINSYEENHHYRHRGDKCDGVFQKPLPNVCRYPKRNQVV